MLCKMKQLPNLWSLNQDLLSVFQVMMSSLVWVIMFSILMTFSIISNVFYIFSFIHTKRYKIFTHSIICFCVITVAIFVNPGSALESLSCNFFCVAWSESDNHNDHYCHCSVWPKACSSCRQSDTVTQFPKLSTQTIFPFSFSPAT